MSDIVRRFILVSVRVTRPQIRFENVEKTILVPGDSHPTKL